MECHGCCICSSNDKSWDKTWPCHLLSACSHGGLVDEGLAYFTSMTKEFGVPAGIEHRVCIVDLHGRSGRLSQAEAFIQKMPLPPNDFVWRSLLAASRIHGNVQLGTKSNWASSWIRPIRWLSLCSLFKCLRNYREMGGCAECKGGNGPKQRKEEARLQLGQVEKQRVQLG